MIMFDYFKELVNEHVKYEQALREIKEIAEKEVHTRMLFADKESFCDFDEILLKCNEVLDEHK